IFISIVIIVLSFTIYHLFPININWPILVLYGILSMWLSVIFIIRRSNNIAKTIMWQVTIISLLSAFWDYNMGWRGWSLDFVIPITCVSAMLVMYVLAKVMKISVRDYIVYFLLNSIFGIVPIVFLLLGWVNIKYPSI